jgi:hypothetical protein
MKVPLETDKAVFVLYSGAKKEVPISYLTKPGASAQYGVTKTGEYTLGVLGISLLVVGTLAALVTGLLFETDTTDTKYSVRDRNISAVAGVLCVSGLLLVYGSKRMAYNESDNRPEVHVTFQETEHQPHTPNAPTIPGLNRHDSLPRPLKLFPDTLPDPPEFQKEKNGLSVN